MLFIACGAITKLRKKATVGEVCLKMFNKNEVEVKNWVLKINSKNGLLNNGSDLTNIAFLIDSLNKDGLSNDGERELIESLYK